MVQCGPRVVGAFVGGAALGSFTELDCALMRHSLLLSLSTFPVRPVERTHRRALPRAMRVALALSLFAPSAALAQSNYRLAPVGGRTTLVGGTGLVYGRDSAAVFLNPATVVRVDPGRLAFSVNIYQFSLVSIPRWYQPGAVDARFGEIPKGSSSVSNFDFDPLPGSLCAFLRAADIPFLSRKGAKSIKDQQGRLGFCISTTQSGGYGFSDESFDARTSLGQTRQAGTVRHTLRRFAVAPSYAMYVDDHLALGASLQISRTSYRNFTGNATTTSLTDGEPIHSTYYGTARGDSHELALAIGATYRVGHQTLALSIDSPSLHLFGSGGMNVSTSYDGAGSATSNRVAEGSFAVNTPLRIAVGTGYEAPWGSVELNLSFHAPIGKAYEASMRGTSYDKRGSLVTEQALDLELSTRARGALNFGVGGELFLSKKISLLAGLSTDRSVVPQGALGRDPLYLFSAATNRVSGSFGLGSHGVGGDLLFGGELGYGWGDRLAVNPYQFPSRLESTPERSYSLLLVLAGSTTFRAIKRAVSDLTGADSDASKKEKEKEKARDRDGGRVPDGPEKMKTDRQTEETLPVPPSGGDIETSKSSPQGR